MSVMTTPDLWSDLDRMLTVDDMENMPDDEFRYELDDGVLIVSPAPSWGHQLVVARLVAILSAACSPELLVLPGVGVNINKFQHRVPDVAVVRDRPPEMVFAAVFAEEPPALAVEVASPRTRLYDQTRKKDIYEGFGISSYWIVAPDRKQPALTAFELRDGRYHVAGTASGHEPFEARLPFPVTVTPAALVTTAPLR